MDLTFHLPFLAFKPYKSMKLLCAFNSVWGYLNEYVCRRAHRTGAEGGLGSHAVKGNQSWVVVPAVKIGFVQELLQ